MIESGKMQGKRVLVTGAGTGIGREVALEFCRQGADVVFHYSRSSEGAAPNRPKRIVSRHDAR